MKYAFLQNISDNLCVLLFDLKPKPPIHVRICISTNIYPMYHNLHCEE